MRGSVGTSQNGHGHFGLTRMPRRLEHRLENLEDTINSFRDKLEPETIDELLEAADIYRKPGLAKDLIIGCPNLPPKTQLELLHILDESGDSTQIGAVGRSVVDKGIILDTQVYSRLFCLCQKKGEAFYNLGLRDAPKQNADTIAEQLRELATGQTEGLKMILNWKDWVADDPFRKKRFNERIERYARRRKLEIPTLAVYCDVLTHLEIVKKENHHRLYFLIPELIENLPRYPLEEGNPNQHFTFFLKLYPFLVGHPNREILTHRFGELSRNSNKANYEALVENAERYPQYFRKDRHAAAEEFTSLASYLSPN